MLAYESSLILLKFMSNVCTFVKMKRRCEIWNYLCIQQNQGYLVTLQEIAAACVTDHMLPISRAIKLLASHSMPLTNGYLIIIYEPPVFLKSQVPVVEMQKGVDICYSP